MDLPRYQLTDESAWPGFTSLRDLPAGYRFATLTEAPTSHLWIVDRATGLEFPLWLGQPTSLDPDGRYALRMGGHRNEAVAGGMGSGSVTYRTRRIRVELTPPGQEPRSGGELRLQLLFSGNTGSLSGVLWEHCTRRLKTYQVEGACYAGADTAAFGVGTVDEDRVGIITGEARALGAVTIAASGNGIIPLYADAMGIIGGATWASGGVGEYTYATLTSTYTGGANVRLSIRGLPFGRA